MATGAINLPPGFELDQPDQSAGINLPPGFELDQPNVPAPQPSILQNAGNELKGMAKSSLSMLGSLTPTNPYSIGKSAYQAMTGTPLAQTDVGQSIANIPNLPKQILSQIGQEVAHPIESFKQRPIGTTLDALTAVGLGTKALSPVMESVGPTIADTAEQFSGLEHKTPGVLGKAYEDPSLIFGQGKDAAREAYQAVQDESQIRPELANAPSKADLVTAARKVLDEGGQLNPDEALAARKALDATKRNWSDLFFRNTRTSLDSIAKQKFAQADTGYARAIQSENLRKFFPLNKTGGSSAFKTALLTPMLPFMSPAMQGAAATTAGVVGRGILSPVSTAAPLFAAGSARQAATNSGPVVNKSSDFQQGLNSANQEQSANAQLQPQDSGPQNQGRVLTEKIARQFLQMAGGVKDKARELARRAGYAIQ